MSNEIPQAVEEHFYRPFCSEDEITRIFNVRNADDYLLKARADYVADHVRHYRVMRRRMNVLGDKWSFSGHFRRDEFDRYLAQLSHADRNRCNPVASGYVFSTEANGEIAPTDFGDVITVSEALRYFLYYMSLAHLDHGIEVPQDVRMHAQMIALRVMLESEALDFDLDPRGTVPADLHARLVLDVTAQLEFVIGHEYAHFLLGHLDDARVSDRILARGGLDGEDPRTLRVYSHSEQRELDADIDAISRVQHSIEYQKTLVGGAILFFAFLDIYELVKNQIAPSHTVVRSHPDSLERLWNIFGRYSQSHDIDKSDVEGLLNALATYKAFLADDVAVNSDSYENYGSVYLADWRGPELIDRVDYYF